MHLQMEIGGTPAEQSSHFKIIRALIFWYLGIICL